MTTGVLLLNATYEPMRVIPVRRAVGLLMRGVAEGVEGIAARLRTPSTVFVVPSVLRLRYYVHVPQRGAVWSRRAVLGRDGHGGGAGGLRGGDRRLLGEDRGVNLKALLYLPFRR